MVAVTTWVAPGATTKPIGLTVSQAEAAPAASPTAASSPPSVSYGLVPEQFS